MSVKASIVHLLLLTGLVLVSAELGEQCFISPQTVGRCVILNDCPQLIQKLQQSPNSSSGYSKAIDIVRQLHCGFSIEEPLVCCSDLPPRPPDPNRIESFQTINVTSPILNTQESSNKNISRPSNNTSAELIQNEAVSSDRMLSSQILLHAIIPVRKQNTREELISAMDDFDTNRIRGEGDYFENCGRFLMNRYFQGYETELDDFPSVALIEYETPQGKVFACGGSLITNQYVLTAARCVSSLGSNVQVKSVRLGEYNFATEVDCLPDSNDKSTYCADKFVDVPIREVIVHPGTSSVGYNRAYDIALIRLARTVKFTQFIQSICLPAEKPIRQKFYTCGWGSNWYRQESQLKYMSILTVIDQRACRKKFAKLGVSIYDDQICAGAGRGEKPCIGDTGGPIMGIEKRSDNTIRMTAFGVLTAVYPRTGPCNSNGWPGIYTEVLDHVPWIKSEIHQRENSGSIVPRMDARTILNHTTT